MKSPFASLLRELREQHGHTVRSLAAATGVSSVWITLIENGHCSAGLGAVEKLAAGLGLREPELTRFRLSGLESGHRRDLLRNSREYGPQVNNALAMHLHRLGIRRRDIDEVTSQPDVGGNDLARLEAALVARAHCYPAGSRNAGTRSEDGPFLEIRFKNGRSAWFFMLVTDPLNNSSRTGAALSAARNPPRPLSRATGSRRTKRTSNDRTEKH